MVDSFSQLEDGHNIVTYEEALLQIVIKIYVTKRGELILKQRLVHSYAQH